MVEFARAMQESGIEPPGMIVCDGKVRRFKVGDETQKSGWYVLFDDPPAGAFGCWKTGLKQNWSMAREYTDAERDEIRQKMDKARAARQAEDDREKKKCREKAARIWGRARQKFSHEYLTRKGVKSHGTRHDLEAVIVPLRDVDGTLHGLQFIHGDGSKKFLTGTAKRGCYFAIGQLTGPLCLCEGFATGASIHECTGYPVAVAFDAGNMVEVALRLRRKYPDVEMIICADNDLSGVGLESGLQAATVCGGRVVVTAEAGTDFNDVHCGQGAEAVKKLITEA